MFDERHKAALAAGRLVPEERRVHPRYHFTAAVEALDQNHRTRMNARTSDIGLGGCYIDTFCPFPLKTAVKVRLSSEKNSFVAAAKVVSSKIGMGMGLQFTDIDPQQLPVLQKWIGEVSGTAPFEPSQAPTFPAPHHPQNGAGMNGHGPKETGYVLNELILALMRTEDEGKTMLLRLLHRDFIP
jgi:PilZ domain